MVELIGSDKQIAWATEIRNSCIRKVQHDIETKTILLGLANAAGDDSSKLTKMIAKLNEGMAQLENDTTHTSAAWWISNKGIADVFIQNVDNM